MTPTARRLGQALIDGGASASWSPEALGLASSVPRYRRAWRWPAWVRAIAEFVAIGVVGGGVLVGGFVAAIAGGRPWIVVYLAALVGASAVIAAWERRRKGGGRP